MTEQFAESANTSRRMTGDNTPDANGGYRNIRRVGAYGFFALCGMGISFFAYALCKRFGFTDDICRLATNAVFFVAFLALRDMTTRPRHSSRPPVQP
jgi:hypothetical protein